MLSLGDQFLHCLLMKIKGKPSVKYNQIILQWFLVAE